MPSDVTTAQEQAETSSIKDKWSEVLPPEGHPRLGKELLRIIGEVIADKTSLGLHEKWIREYKLARGAHWDKPANVPLKTANLV